MSINIYSLHYQRKKHFTLNLLLNIFETFDPLAPHFENNLIIYCVKAYS